MKDVENEVFLYEKDKLFNGDIKRYLKDVGTVPMFSRDLKEEEAAGKALTEARTNVLNELIAIRPSENRITILQKHLLRDVNYNHNVSYKKFFTDLEQINNIWIFVAMFINQLGCWPSFKRLKQKFGNSQILQFVFEIRLLSLAEESKLLFCLEKNQPVLVEDFPLLHKKIFLKISQGFKIEEYRKYWRAEIFDELENFPKLPGKVALAMKILSSIENEFVAVNLRFAAYFAKKYYWVCKGSKLDFLDLVQEGNLGLFRAVRRFDPTLGYKFTTFAGWWVRQSIQRQLEFRLV